MDRTDYQILNLLQRDCRATLKSVGDQVGLTAPAGGKLSRAPVSRLQLTALPRPQDGGPGPGSFSGQQTSPSLGPAYFMPFS